MKSWQKKTITNLLFIGLFIGVLIWQSRHLINRGETISSEDQSRTLTLIDGSTTSLEALKGKTTMLYFFAPWCTVCQFSAGNLRQFEGKDINLLMVALDYDSIEEVTEFLKGVKLPLPTILGDEGLKDIFKINAYPTYYILDENLTVRSSSVGYSTWLGLKFRWLIR